MFEKLSLKGIITYKMETFIVLQIFNSAQEWIRVPVSQPGLSPIS